MRLLRTRDVCERIGVSRQTLWRMIKDGAFPERRYLIGRVGVTGWFEHEVDAWLEANAVRAGIDVDGAEQR